MAAKAAVTSDKPWPIGEITGMLHDWFLNVRHAYGIGSICLNVPFFDNQTGMFTKEKGSMVFNIGYSQAIRVLKAHVKQLKRELAALQPKEV